VKILLALPLLMVACSDYEIHDNNDALGKYNPPDLGADVKTDRIVQVTVPSVDVLWVIDNSCSMEEEQSSLTGNFSKFMNYFTNSGLDYHVGVVSAEGIPVMPYQLRRIDPASMTNFDDPLSAGTLLMSVELVAGERVQIIVP